MNIENLQPREIDFDGRHFDQRPISNIHLRVHKRNKKKALTLIEGLAEDLDLKKILKALKKTCQTNGAILDHDGKKFLQLNGDNRENTKEFFIRYKIWESPDPPIKIHGI